MTRTALISALLGSLALSMPATAKVFFRVAPSALPAAEKTGVEDLVLVWPFEDSSALARFRSAGYRVWLECDVKDLAKTSALADRAQAAGVIIAGIRDPAKYPAVREIRTYA